MKRRTAEPPRGNIPERRVAYLSPNEMALILRFRETRHRAHTQLMYCRDTYDDQPGAVYWSAVVDAVAEQDAAEAAP